MTPTEFETQINRLKEVFGAQAYKTERAAILYEIVINCEVRALEYAVKNWIVDAKSPPLGEQFKEFARRQMVKSYSNMKPDIKAEPKCHECSDNGLVVLEMKPELKEYAVRHSYPFTCAALCMCPAGQIKKAKYTADGNHDIAKRQYSLMLMQWYDIQNVWQKESYSQRPVREILADIGGKPA